MTTDKIKDILGRLYKNHPQAVMDSQQLKDHLYTIQISMQEYMLIWAGQVSNALERIEYDSQIPSHLKEHLRYYYADIIDTYRPFKGLKDAETHLKKVNAYYNEKFGNDYEFNYLFGISDRIYERISGLASKSGKREKASVFKNSTWED
jgi:hypothetical protein